MAFKFTRARSKINLIIDVLENIENLFFEVNNRDESKDLLVFLITQKQLFEKGEDGNEKSLGEYSPFTVEIKRAKGQPFDRITLNDSGDFYDSFEVVVRINEIVIIADTIKVDTDLSKDFGLAILKPSEKSLEIYRSFLLMAIRELIRKEVRAIKGLS